MVYIFQAITFFQSGVYNYVIIKMTMIMMIIIIIIYIYFRFNNNNLLLITKLLLKPIYN